MAALGADNMDNMGIQDTAGLDLELLEDSGEAYPPQGSDVDS